MSIVKFSWSIVALNNKKRHLSRFRFCDNHLSSPECYDVRVHLVLDLILDSAWLQLLQDWCAKRFIHQLQVNHDTQVLDNTHCTSSYTTSNHHSQRNVISFCKCEAGGIKGTEWTLGKGVGNARSLFNMITVIDITYTTPPLWFTVTSLLIMGGGMPDQQYADWLVLFVFLLMHRHALNNQQEVVSNNKHLRNYSCCFDPCSLVDLSMLL